MKGRILFLEDDERLRKSLAEDFIERGYQVVEAQSINEVKGQSFDYAVVDMRLVGEHGLNAIEHLKKVNSNCHIVVLTGYSSVATAVEAVKRGALNYLVKPISPDLLEQSLLDNLKDDSAFEERAPTLSKHEHEYIDFVLTQNDGNISKTAKILGLHRQSLQRKLKKLP